MNAPTVDVNVIAAFVVAVIGVAVGGVVDEQVRNPISGNVVTFLRASFDGLKKAEITVGQADLDKREIIGGFGIRIEAAQLASPLKHRIEANVCGRERDSF